MNPSHKFKEVTHVIAAHDDEVVSSANTNNGSGSCHKTSDDRHRRKAIPDLPNEYIIIQTVKKPHTVMNHSYRDFSQVPLDLNYTEKQDIDQMSFNEKVHHMVSQPEHSKWVHWMPHGRAFLFEMPKMLESNKILDKYFGHSRFSSLLRQLSNHGYKHISEGRDRNCYYHELVLRGMPHLVKFMPESKNARRLTPDPDNEPNLYSISKAHPLPDDPEYGKNDGFEEFELSTFSNKRPAMDSVMELDPYIPASKRQVRMPGQITFVPQIHTDLDHLYRLLLQSNNMLAAETLRGALHQPLGPVDPSTVLAAILRLNQDLNNGRRMM